MHPYFGLKYLGVEEDENWLDRPSEERNLEGLENLLCTILKSTGREGMA